MTQHVCRSMSAELQRLICDSALNMTSRRNLKIGKGAITHANQFSAPQFASDIGWLKLKSINNPLLLSHCHPGRYASPEKGGADCKL